MPKYTGLKDFAQGVQKLYKLHKQPPEEDAESLVRHRNRATTLDKKSKKC